MGIKHKNVELSLGFSLSKLFEQLVLYTPPTAVLA